MNDLKTKAFSTRAVHAGERVLRTDFVPVATPIYSSVGYLYGDMETVDAVFAGERPGFVYLRYGNPTLEAFEAALADLEGAEAAHAFASGMAAVHAALLAAGVQSGACVVAALDLYGATFTLLRAFLSQLSVRTVLVDVTDLEAVEDALRRHRPVALLAETISNPLLKVADVPSLAELAHRWGAQLLIDNTFASPYLFNPIRYGADYVIHSATKYLCGHGDVLAGVVATSRENRRKLNELTKLIGGVLGPFEAWLVLRGLKTLPLRVHRQCENAAKVAEWLSRHPRVSQVHYPGSPHHPQHALAKSLFAGRGFGGVLSFEIIGAAKETVFKFMDSLTIWLPAATLGDIYSLALHPATASHRNLTAEERAAVGISDGLLRLSAGIEDTEDLIADLEQALAKVQERV